MTRRTRAVLAGLLCTLTAALVYLATPASLGGYTTSVRNSTNTAASGIWATTCLAQAQADGAYFFYRLDDAALQTTAADSSGNARPGTYTLTGVMNRAVAGPCPRDNQNNVITLNGSTGYVSGPQIAGAGPTNFSSEIWFRTSTAAGGKLIGLGTARTGASGTYDRHIYMTNDGRLTAGIYDGTTRTVSSTSAYNDNTWHQAVMTVATTGTYKGMRLYVDGALVASTTTYFTSEAGSNYYVRIGYDNLNSWPNAPTNGFFAGSLADAAFYNGTVLTPTQVTAHYNAGK